MNIAIKRAIGFPTRKLLPLVHPVMEKYFVKQYSGNFYQFNYYNNLCKYQFLKIPIKNVRVAYKFYITRYNSSAGTTGSSVRSPQTDKTGDEPPVVQNVSIFQKMKQMTKDYWHILIPVHVVTSLGWAAIFYTAAKNGVDIVGIMESLNLSESYLERMKGSNAGHWAVTYALYKVFTPLRYTVTVGSTTMTIRYLNKWGYLKLKKRVVPEDKGTKKCPANQERGNTGSNISKDNEGPPKT